MELQKCLKNILKSMVWSVFRGPILEDQSGPEAFPSCVALVFSFSEAFPCSVAFVFRLSDVMKRYKNNSFGAWHRLGVPQGILRGMLLGHFFALSVQKQIFPDLHMIRGKPIAVFNKMVSSKRGSLGEGSGDSFFLYRPKSHFSGPQYNPL